MVWQPLVRMYLVKIGKSAFFVCQSHVVAGIFDALLCPNVRVRQLVKNLWENNDILIIYDIINAPVWAAFSGCLNREAFRPKLHYSFLVLSQAAVKAQDE